MIQLLERPYEVCFSRNPVVYRLKTTTALNTPGLKVDTRVFFRKKADNDFVQVIANTLTPDSAGLVEIDYSKVMDSMLDYKLPTVSAVTAERAFEQVGEFYIEYREITTAAPNPTWTSDNGNVITVVKGGLPIEKWQGPNYFINRDGNLTWQKTGRYIGPREKTWMTYLHLGTNNQANMAMKVNVYFTDGTSMTDAVTVTLPDASVPKYGLYRIPAGAQLNLKDLDTAKQIHYYTCRIVAGTTNQTVEFRYTIDYRANYSKATLYWFNSLGGFDSVELKGEMGRKVGYDRQYGERTLGGKYYSNNEAPAMQESIRNLEQMTYQGSIGLMDDEDSFDRYRDLTLSVKVMMLRFNRFIPVVITNSSVDLGSDADPVKDFPIEFTPGFVNENYAPDIRIGELPACPVLTSFSFNVGASQLTWGPAIASHVQYVLELWDADRTAVNSIIYQSGTTYSVPFSAIGWARVKAVCGFAETPFTDFVYYFG